MIMTKQEENKIYKIKKKNEDEINGSNKIKRQNNNNNNTLPECERKNIKL